MSISLSGCNTASSHWDFIFRITAALKSGTACDCDYLRLTFFDNPKRTRLWISNNTTAGNPQTNTNDSPRLFVQKVLAAGATAAFPAEGDTVRRVGGASNSFQTDSGTASVGTITAPGTADDSLHTLILPNGSLPCSASGPMAYLRVECGASPNGPWTPLGGLAEINPCVPMIQATVCRFDTDGNDRFRLGISVLNSCGIPASSFRVTNIQRSNDTNFPNAGTSVWSGNQALSNAVTNINMTSTGSGGELWISFTTDGGTNTSRIRVSTNDTACPVTPPGTLAVVSNTCVNPNGTANDVRSLTVSWTGDATRYRHREGTTGAGGWSAYATLTASQIANKQVSFTKNDTGCNSVGQVEICNGDTCVTINYAATAAQGLASVEPQTVEQPTVEQPTVEETTEPAPTDTAVPEE